MPGHLLRFGRDGALVGEFDGSATAPEIDGQSQWPSNAHGLLVDEKGTLWISGNDGDGDGDGDGDHVIVNDTPEGQFIRQVRRR